MSHRVLIVEDDHGIQQLLQAVLQHHGIECSTTGDGDGALKLLSRESFGAILLDLLLPSVNGFDVLRHLKNTNDELLPRVIVITAAAETTLRDSEDLGRVRCVLRKPLDIDELMSHVAACLNGDGAGTLPHPEKIEGQRDIRWRSR